VHSDRNNAAAAEFSDDRLTQKTPARASRGLRPNDFGFVFATWSGYVDSTAARESGSRLDCFSGGSSIDRTIFRKDSP
jgi:hypothetical protein